jgi:hypothetical protein
MKRITLLLLLFIIHYSLFTLQAQEISFFKENITMKLEQDHFYVSGNYFLKTTGDQSITLVYPFPVDTLYGDVDSLRIFNLSTNRLIEPLDVKKEAAVLKVDFGDLKEVEILISYRQKLLGNRAEYILESTRSWRKPLEQADYELIVPDRLKINSFSYPPDESIAAGTETIYYWSRSNFMPSVNMVFEFKPEK